MRQNRVNQVISTIQKDQEKTPSRVLNLKKAVTANIGTQNIHNGKKIPSENKKETGLADGYTKFTFND